MARKKRQLDNWLHGLAQYVEETESPRHFWLWSGIYCIAAAMQRKCWLPFGMGQLFPNLYIMIVAPPGRCRKGAPVGLAKKFLEDRGIQIPVFVDSPTKRALTQHLDELGGHCTFHIKNESGVLVPRTQSPLALISKELSSFLAVDAKGMIEALTDLFDNHEVWEYKTSGKGSDRLYGPILNCLFASTPTWITANLPPESIGGGFTSRFLILYGTEKYKFVPLPPEPPEELYRTLVHDLALISKLTGSFSWGPGAREFYEKWYRTIEGKVKATHDERIHAYLERIHILSLKTAMCLRVARSDDLTIEEVDMRQAVALCEDVLEDTANAFGALGRSNQAVAIQELTKQLRILKKTTKRDLYRLNYRNMTKNEFHEVLESLEIMGHIKIVAQADMTTGATTETIHWLPAKEKKDEHKRHYREAASA